MPHPSPVLASHGLELVDPLLGVALPDLTQRLVLVPALPHVLVVDDVVVGPLVLVPGLGQLVGQGLQREAAQVRHDQERWVRGGQPPRHPGRQEEGRPPARCPHHQLPLHPLVLLGLGDALLLVAVIQDALARELGAVARVLCTLVLQAVLDVVAHRLVDRGGRGWGGGHHQVQLLLGLHQVILGFFGL